MLIMHCIQPRGEVHYKRQPSLSLRSTGLLIRLACILDYAVRTSRKFAPISNKDGSALRTEA